MLVVLGIAVLGLLVAAWRMPLPRSQPLPLVRVAVAEPLPRVVPAEDASGLKKSARRRAARINAARAAQLANRARRAR